MIDGLINDDDDILWMNHVTNDDDDAGV